MAAQALRSAPFVLVKQGCAGQARAQTHFISSELLFVQFTAAGDSDSRQLRMGVEAGEALDLIQAGPWAAEKAEANEDGPP